MPESDVGGGVRVLAAEDVLTARDAVAQYLRDVGLSDPDLVAAESRCLVDEAERTPAAGDGETALAAVALRLAVQRLDQWLRALSARSGVAEQAGRLGGVVGARLPSLLSRYPHALKQDPPSELAGTVREDLTPVVPPPQPRPMRRQQLALLPAPLRRLLAKIAGLRQHLGARSASEGDVGPRSRFGLPGQRCSPTQNAVGDQHHHADGGRPAQTFSRRALAVATLTSTARATATFHAVSAADGFGRFGGLDALLTALFAILFLWVSFSFWAATFGFLVLLRRRPPAAEPSPSPAHLPPTALVMPIHNEDPLRVFANLHAVAQSLAETGHAGAFSIFVLSDTTDPRAWLEEERAWAKLAVDVPAEVRVFYRHRPENTGRKAGNVADFCRRWGGLYRYLIVLDADSLMEGATMVELVRRMEAGPAIGILQAPPRPVARHTFFARLVQFAAHVYGPVFLEGFALWSQCDGNYWGHNAILRLRPFMEHCDLPVLPGDGPLGGEILSQDFVEAALMRRAGYQV